MCDVFVFIDNLIYVGMILSLFSISTFLKNFTVWWILYNLKQL